MMTLPVIQKPSPNFNDRADGKAPAYLIFHYTGMENATAALDRLTDETSGVSAHYTIDEDGKIYAHVPEDKRAWHAGEAFWHGETDLNSTSIGIEIVNGGHDFGLPDFPETQIDSVRQLSLDMMARYDIPPENVLAHSDIAPSRKQDPGEKFPWALLAKKGIGQYPNPCDEDVVKAAGIALDRALCDFGYNPRTPFLDRLMAFQRHFVPEVFTTGEVGVETPLTRTRLYALLAAHVVPAP